MEKENSGCHLTVKQSILGTMFKGTFFLVLEQGTYPWKLAYDFIIKLYNLQVCPIRKSKTSGNGPISLNKGKIKYDIYPNTHRLPDIRHVFHKLFFFSIADQILFKLCVILYLNNTKMQKQKTTSMIEPYNST